MRSLRRATWNSSGGLVLIGALVWGRIANADSTSRGAGAAPLDAGDPTPEAHPGTPASGPDTAETWSSIIKDRLGITASVRAASFSKDLSFDGETGFAVGSLWLTAKPQDVLGIRTYLDGRVQGQNLTRRSHLTWDVREAYAETALGDFDFKAGRQLTVWGRADKINPTDLWSTRDYTLLAPDDEDQLLGVAAVQVAWN